MISFSIIGILWVVSAWLWLTKLRRRHPAPNVFLPLTATIAILVGSCGLAALWGGWLFPTTLTDNGRMRLDYAKGYKAGAELQSAAPGTAATLFCAADEAGSERIHSIQEGLAAAGITQVTISGIAPGRKLPMGSEDVPDSCRLTARDFDQAIQGASEGSAWIFAVELPRDFGRMRLWKKNYRTPVYWLDVNNPNALRPALATGRLSGYCSIKGDAAFDNVNISSNPEIAFQSRYEWIGANAAIQ